MTRMVKEFCPNMKGKYGTILNILETPPITRIQVTEVIK